MATRVISRPNASVFGAWGAIGRKLARGEHPAPAELIAALQKREAAVPADVQVYIAAVLNGDVTRRGRPRTSPDREARRALALVTRVDGFASDFRELRTPNAKWLAFEKVAVERRWGVDTVKRKYHEARRVLRSSSSIWAALWLPRYEGDEK